MHGSHVMRKSVLYLWVIYLYSPVASSRSDKNGRSKKAVHWNNEKYRYENDRRGYQASQGTCKALILFYWILLNPFFYLFNWLIPGDIHNKRHSFLIRNLEITSRKKKSCSCGNVSTSLIAINKVMPRGKEVVDNGCDMKRVVWMSIDSVQNLKSGVSQSSFCHERQTRHQTFL